MAHRLDPDYIEDEANSIAKVFADALAIANKGGIYNEQTSWQKWMVGICAVLVASGIIGSVAMYGKLTAFEVKLEDLKDQVGRLTYAVEHRQP